MLDVEGEYLFRSCRVNECVERRAADPQYRATAHLAGCGACAEEAEALRELVS